MSASILAGLDALLLGGASSSEAVPDQRRDQQVAWTRITLSRATACSRLSVPGRHGRSGRARSQPGLSVDGLPCFDCAGEMSHENFEDADGRFAGAGLGEWLPGHIEEGFRRR